MVQVDWVQPQSSYGLMADATRLGSSAIGARASGTVAATRGMPLLLLVEGSAVAATQLGAYC